MALLGNAACLTKERLKEEGSLNCSLWNSFQKNHYCRIKSALKCETFFYVFFKLNLQMVKSNRDEVQALELIGESREEFCIFFAGLLSSRHNFELSAPWSRTPCRSSDYIRDALQNSKYCRGH